MHLKIHYLSSRRHSCEMRTEQSLEHSLRLHSVYAPWPRTSFRQCAFPAVRSSNGAKSWPGVCAFLSLSSASGLLQDVLRKGEHWKKMLTEYLRGLQSRWPLLRKQFSKLMLCQICTSCWAGISPTLLSNCIRLRWSTLFIHLLNILNHGDSTVVHQQSLAGIGTRTGIDRDTGVWSDIQIR